MAKSSANEAVDGFILPRDEPYPVEQKRLSQFLAEVQQAGPDSGKPQQLPAGRELLAGAKEELVRTLFAALNRMLWLCLQRQSLPNYAETNEDLEAIQAHELLQRALSALIGVVAARKHSLQDAHLLQLVDVVVTATRKDGDKPPIFDLGQTPIPGVLPLLIGEAETRFGAQGLPSAFRPGLQQLEAILTEWEFWAGYKKTLARLRPLLKSDSSAPAEAALPDAGEAWADVSREDIAAMKPGARGSWIKLLANIPAATVAKPTAKWKAAATELLEAVGREEFARQSERWFALVGARAQQRLGVRNGLILRALIWYASLLDGEVVCRALANAIEGGCRKLPQGGLFASSLAKAGIAALETMPGLEPLAQLSRLKHRLKSPWGLEEVEKALAIAVKRTGASLTEVEEVSCPTFDLDAEGRLVRPLGDFVAEVAVTGTHEVTLTWRDSKGQALAREPSQLKAQATEVKALKQLARDIEKMLQAQRERIERLLLAGRTWAVNAWRSRYLDHPLLSQQTRRLIWQFTDGKRSEAGIWLGGKIVTVQGKSLDWLRPTSQVQLWHPLGVPSATVQGWRQWLEDHQVSQPFKQAHREIYLLTDAEIATRTYSNRFAAHILRQHQFKALCDARGWKYEFLGNWDSGGNTGATLLLPGGNGAAHFWLNHAGNQYSPAGVCVYASTDQVRFSDEQSPAKDLANIPALIFSEVMRDVDLFVSVCSIGTDPAWNQATAAPAAQAEAPHQDYWQQFAFGDLSATAQTRRDVLERLLPRLRIATCCSVEKKFLVVKGSLRTYKIHLGSGNILMKPNDQYLCIVPDRGSASAKAGDKLFLPFEGDSTLSIILSKAFLLADDQKIKDETILRQLKAG